MDETSVAMDEMSAPMDEAAGRVGHVRDMSEHDKAGLLLIAVLAIAVGLWWG